MFVEQQQCTETEDREGLERWKDSKRTADVKLSERNSAIAVGLLKHQPCNEKSAKHKKDQDAETTGNLPASVVEDDKRNRDGPQSIQSRQVAAG
jgi:hypothetical protein